MELLTIIAILLVCAFVFWKVVQVLGNFFALVFGFIFVLCFVETKDRLVFMNNLRNEILK
jgi:hypothetical protein